MKGTVYPEDLEIKQLERVLGKGAQQALDEYGFGDLFAVGKTSINYKPNESTDETSSTVYSISSETHTLPSFLKPSHHLDVSESLSFKDDKRQLQIPQTVTMGSSAITKHMNRLVETNIEEVVDGVLDVRTFYDTDHDIGMALADCLVENIKDSYDHASTMTALFGVFIYCLHLKNPQICHVCTSSLYVTLYTAIKSSKLYSTSDIHSFLQGLNSETDSDTLIVNLTETLSYAIVFRGAAVTPLGDLLDILLQVNVLVTTTTEEGAADAVTNVSFYVLSPAVYKLLSKILRIADSLLLKLCPKQYKEISKRVSSDAESMKELISSANITTEQQRFAIKLRVYEAVLKEARSTASRGHQVEPTNPNLKSIYEFFNSLTGKRQAILQEQSLADCLTIIQKLRNIQGVLIQNPDGSVPTVNRSIDAVLDTLWDKFVTLLVIETFETGPLRNRPANSIGLNYSDSELVACKYFCFLIEDIKRAIEDRQRIANAWKAVYKETVLPDGISDKFSKYGSKRLCYLSSKEGIEHNIQLYLQKPVQKLAVPSLFLIILTLNSSRSFFDHTLLLLLRSLIAAPGRHDFRYQLGLAIWDYVATFQNVTSRQVTNTARLVAYLLGCPTTSGLHGISYSILKKHILCDSGVIQTKSTRSSLPQALRVFYDFLFCFLLTGKTHKVNDAALGTDLFHAKMAFGPLITQVDQGLLSYTKNEEKDTDGMMRIRRGVLLYLDELQMVYTKGDKQIHKIINYLYTDQGVFELHCCTVMQLLLDRVKQTQNK